MLLLIAILLSFLLFVWGGIIMTDFFNWLAYDILWGTPLIVLMIFTGLYFTIRSGFFRSLILSIF